MVEKVFENRNGIQNKHLYLQNLPNNSHIQQSGLPNQILTQILFIKS